MSILRFKISSWEYYSGLRSFVLVRVLCVKQFLDFVLARVLCVKKLLDFVLVRVLFVKKFRLRHGKRIVCQEALDFVMGRVLCVKKFRLCHGKSIVCKEAFRLRLDGRCFRPDKERPQD